MLYQEKSGNSALVRKQLRLPNVSTFESTK
jgi:hypothetical protein